MENVKKSEKASSWKLIWDAETKDVLFFKKIDGELETVNELFETENLNEIYHKIEELNLNYNPKLFEEECY